jgi:hypothetical protein
MNQGPAIKRKTIRMNGLKSRIEFRQWNFGQEPQHAQVHSQDGNPSLGHGTRCGEQRPVASQHNDVVRLSHSDLVAINDLSVIRVGGRFAVNQDGVMVLVEPLEQLWQDVGQLWLCRLGNNRN